RTPLDAGVHRTARDLAGDRTPTEHAHAGSQQRDLQVDQTVEADLVDADVHALVTPDQRRDAQPGIHRDRVEAHVEVEQRARALGLAAVTRRRLVARATRPVTRTPVPRSVSRPITRSPVTGPLLIGTPASRAIPRAGIAPGTGRTRAGSRPST